jgi:hypothetical protein
VGVTEPVQEHERDGYRIGMSCGETKRSQVVASDGTCINGAELSMNGSLPM